MSDVETTQSTNGEPLPTGAATPAPSLQRADAKHGTRVKVSVHRLDGGLEDGESDARILTGEGFPIFTPPDSERARWIPARDIKYIVVGLNRAQIGYQQSGSGRYVYEGAVFWLLLLADAARNIPWRGTWRPAIVACMFLACFNSGVLLYAYSAAKTEQMLREAADLQALAAERGNPCLDPTAIVDQLVMPQVTSPGAYYRAVDRYGDPAAGTPVVRGPDFERARANLLKPGCP
jgi:hypothetical protein